MQDASGGALSKQVSMVTWLGTSEDKNPRVLDAPLTDARLNEPNGCWARTSPDSQAFLGLYIADTGNDCLRFAHPDGRVETLQLHGVPDVRSTALECAGGVCRMPEAAAAQEEEKKE
mmetsp:Transcript_2865/g.3911  ORF Transcript_2865/g.3911 Transcript_2865/m.3911 type:complete len:117 (+) Transcript_2865:1279-1629(+)